MSNSGLERMRVYQRIDKELKEKIREYLKKYKTLTIRFQPYKGRKPQ